MLKKLITGIVVLTLLLFISGFTFYTLNKSPDIFEPSVAGIYHSKQRVIDASSVRNTQSGEVVGFADAYNTHAWIGIPYAAPPINDLRWRAPQAVSSWTGRRSAIEYGNPCIQYWGNLAGVDGETGKVVGNEDCLTLNIWSPKRSQDDALTGEKTPVMVWIHGGNNDSGTGNIFQAHNLAGNKNLIVVTINYRLGFLGWFSHDAVRDTSNNLEDASGNFGTLDIIAALRWVQDNIAQFGGDPNNVTIFGESAGGRNVYSMLASPLAKGLFHKAISQSGTSDSTPLVMAEEFKDPQSKALLTGLKNSSNGLIELVFKSKFPDLSQTQIRQKISVQTSDELMAMLRAMNPLEMMTLANANTEFDGYIQTANVLRDGHVMPKESTLALFNDPDSYNSVPMILGSNRDENKLFMSRNPDYVTYFLGVLPRIKDLERYNRISKYVSDNWKAGAVDEPAKRIERTDAPDVFAYRFDWDDSPSNWLFDLPNLIGAAHGVEMSFVFGDFKGGAPLSFLINKNNAPGRKTLSETMMDYWAQFAHTGNPGRGHSGSQMPWHAWRSQGNNVMILDSERDGGARMGEIRTNVVDIKRKLSIDNIITEQYDRCQAYAFLFLHGYQASDFWNRDEYNKLGCANYPVIEFRNS